MASFVYHSAKEHIAKSAIDLDSHTFKMALLSSSHTPDQTNDTVLTDVSTEEVSGTGYTAGGYTLANVTVTRSGATVKFDADDIVVNALDPSFRYAVVYDDTHASDALLCLLDPGALQEPAGDAVKLAFNASGILTLTDA